MGRDHAGRRHAVEVRHPGQARRPRTEAVVAALAVEELLRYDSPVQLAGRSARPASMSPD
jgi:cytochrome P450